VNPQPWDTALLGRIAQLHLLARRAVAGWHQGQHLSHKASTNIEFVDYKDYAPGDPISAVDWRVAARTDRLVIRRHVAETEVPVTLLIDASGDLGTGRPDLDGSKLGATIVLAASLAMVLERGGDPVGLEVVGGQGHHTASLPPRRASLPGIMRALAALEAQGIASLAEAFTRIGHRLSRRSIVIVLSDLMEDPVSWAPSIGALSQRGVDVRVLHIHDPAEWALDFDESVNVFSPEGGEAMPLDPGAARAEMGTVVDDYLSEVRAALACGRARHHLVASDAPLDAALHAVLGGRS
jgi:uncharacterized protein (DUF58 family)